MPKKPTEGSVYHLAGRGGWHVAFYDVDGRRKVRKAKPNTQAGAYATLHEMLRKRDEGELVGRSGSFAEFANHWLTLKRTAGCRPRTIEAYHGRLRLYILPKLGGLSLRKVTPVRIDELYAELLTRISPQTVKGVHDTLHALLLTAHKRRLIGAIPTELVDPPKRQKFEATIMTISQAKALLKGTALHRHGNMWAFILGTGCRFGEAAGLTWDSVDLDQGLAYIRQQVSIEAKRHVLSPVKTEAGKRVVPLPPFVVAALRRQRARVDLLKEHAEDAWIEKDLVFPGDRGDLLHDIIVRKAWHRELRGLGLPDMRMHDLRHTKGTLMADAGEDTTVIQRTLGHAKQSITAELYIDRIPAALKAAAVRFGAMLDDSDV
jgi:integrase